MTRIFWILLVLIAFSTAALSQQSPNSQQNPNMGNMQGQGSMQGNMPMQGTTGIQSSTTSGNPANEQNIFQQEKNLWEAWKNHNAQPFQQTISPNAVDVSGSGVRTGQQNVIQDLTSGNCQVTSYSLSDQKFTWYDPNTVLLTYRADQDATCNGQKLPSSVYASSLWVYQGGKWQAAFHQETPAMQTQSSQSPRQQ